MVEDACSHHIERFECPELKVGWFQYAILS